MDSSIDPCQDFYQYSCGSWIKNTELPPDKISFTKSFSSIAEENEILLKNILEENWPLIGPFYKSCMNLPTINQNGITPTQTLFDEITAIHDTTSLLQTIGHLHNHGISALFAFFVDTDSKDPSMTLPTFWQSGLGMPNKDYYAEGPNFQDLQNKYKQYITQIFSLFSQDSGVANLIFEYEKELAKFSLSPTEMRDPESVYHKQDLTSFQLTTPNLAWNEYLSQRGAPSFSSVNVGMPNFFSGINQLIQSQPLETTKLYLRWHLFLSTGHLLSQNILDIRFNWSHALYGSKQPPARWKYCVSQSDSLLGELLGRYFVERHFSGESKNIAQQLVSDLEESFSSNLKTLDWMTEETKKAAEIKLRHITNKIGYPNNWTDYNSLHLLEDKYFENHMKMQLFYNQKEMNKIGKPVDKSEWFMTPSQVNAYYNPSANEIVFPAAILQPPFFKQNYPAFANFGGIGAVVGHEITHGFDDQGRQFDETGLLRNWWKEEDIQAFTEKAQCVVDAYNNYEVLPGLFINGKLTEGENLADLGGLRISYKAYKEWIKSKEEGMTDEEMKKYFPGLTSDQLFFISFAQVWCSKQTDEYAAWLTNTNPHSLAKFRAIGATSNLNHFWDAFKCDVNTPMHPKNSCRVW